MSPFSISPAQTGHLVAAVVSFLKLHSLHRKGMTTEWPSILPSKTVFTFDTPR
ncbi:MAG: hypothetical protein NUV60_02690 [Patescibacteria group bacterium]|nr:hypothetical protein [Patescibacteria group bacterium]